MNKINHVPFSPVALACSAVNAYNFRTSLHLWCCQWIPGKKHSHFVCRYHCHLAGETLTCMTVTVLCLNSSEYLLAAVSSRKVMGVNHPPRPNKTGARFYLTIPILQPLLRGLRNPTSLDSFPHQPLEPFFFFPSVCLKRTEATRLSLHDCHPEISPGVAEGSTTNPLPLFSKFWDQSQNSDFKMSDFYGLNQKYGASQDQLLYFLLFFAFSISPRNGHSTEEGAKGKRAK